MKEYYEKDMPNKDVRDCDPEEIALLVRVGKLKANKAAGMMKFRGRNELSEFARHMGYSEGWVYNRMKYGR